MNGDNENLFELLSELTDEGEEQPDGGDPDDFSLS